MCLPWCGVDSQAGVDTQVNPYGMHRLGMGGRGRPTCLPWAGVDSQTGVDTQVNPYGNAPVGHGR